ncbi:MAG: diguanylate cyclase [Peptococcaceae bacterium BRH_c23]|nr:MAG: diguanylate cyclase [Peptococcaceae bacterium BRH_c23]HBW38827.1 GGDEF domain-containing protein [Desulfosporosinus sp.]
MNKLWLLIAMVFTGILYSVVLLYFMDMPLFNNLVLHCIIAGTLFGLTNFIVAVLFYKRLETQKRLNQQLKVSLMTDNLTGLLNRRAFDHDIKHFDYSGLYSLIFLDIDNFRDFNNHFGHDIGDNVLKKVGETIKACIRATDRVYRYGGEEIILLLLDCDKKNAMKMAEKIRSEISRLDNQAYPQITVSLGVSSYPDDGRYIHDLIVASDKALLKAKHSGKNCSISS